MRWLLLTILIGIGTARGADAQPQAAAGRQRVPLDKGAVEAGGVAGTTLPVRWLRAHSDRHITLASLEVGRVLTGQLGHGALSGSFEMLLTVTPLFVIQQPARTLGLAASPLHL